MSRPFRIAQLSPNRVIDVNAIWRSIDFKPTYQRQSDVWEDGKKQLFVDSLINGYDIPKLYFHELGWDATRSKRRYAIVDGKQRLEAIHAFIDGEYALSDEFEDIDADSPERARRAANLSYRELAKQFPAIKARFDEAALPIVLIQTDDLESIEELFSRLNEAVPLNAPEKRNALGGPLPRQIRKLAQHSFFASRLAFPNARYRHLDLATKFLYMEYRDGLTDLKKRDLDDFVKKFRAEKLVGRASELHRTATGVLDRMDAVFVQSDPLLTSIGMITIYYELFREAAKNHWLDEISRDKLMKFDDERNQNKTRVKEAQELALEGKKPPPGARINNVLTQFERYVQSPNDQTALTHRYRVLRSFIRRGRIPAVA